MPSIGIIQSAHETEATRATSLAFDMVCNSLHLAKRDDLVAEVVARKIVQLAAAGERDPVRLQAAVMRWVECA